MKRILAGMAVLVLVAHAHAESRTVLIQVKQDKEKKVTVAIHSDEKTEQKAAASVADAVTVIREMKGWGSKVGVYVAADRAIPRADVKKLLVAVNDNVWLSLEYFGREVPKGVADHFLKAAQGPLPSPQKPRVSKDILVGRWVSDAADRIPVEFGADGSIRIAVCKLDWKWQIAEGTYAVGDDGRVKYRVKLGGLTGQGYFLFKDGVLIGPTGANAETRWKKAPNGPANSDPPAAPQRAPEKLFQTACKRIADLESKHDLLKGASKVKPTVQRDEQGRLKSAHFIFENNAVPPEKNAARAKDASRPFFYVSVQTWAGRTPSPPANLHEYEWQGQIYQTWVRVYGSDAELVKLVRNSVDEPLRGPFPPEAPSSDKLPGSRSSVQTVAPVTVAVIVAVAREKAEVQSRHAAHLSTRSTPGKGEVIEGGGYVFFAQCRQKFQVLEVLRGDGKPGDRVLEYSFVEKTDGFPLPAVQEPVPAGAKLILLLGEKGNILKALPDTQENRKAVRTALPERKQKEGEPAPQAATHKAADVELIANWLSGKDPLKAFARPFGDRTCLSDSKDLLLYTDVDGVKPPVGMKAVNYEFVQQQMQQIKHGHKASPAVLIVRSSLDEPVLDEKRDQPKTEPGGRTYYVEVAIGNLAWHWLKVVVRDKDDKPTAQILWRRVS